MHIPLVGGGLKLRMRSGREDNGNGGDTCRKMPLMVATAVLETPEQVPLACFVGPLRAHFRRDSGGIFELTRVLSERASHEQPEENWSSDWPVLYSVAK